MARTHERRTDDEPDEQRTPDIYLPAMAPLSNSAGRVERFVANLFRRRGGLRPVRRSK